MKLGVEAAVVAGALVPGDVEIADGRIVRVAAPSANGRGIAVAGLVDLQVNGFAGVDFAGADAAGYARAGEALLECGVTAYLPTLITAPETALAGALRSIPTERARGPRILGAHVEGPFLAPERMGTHMLGSRRDPDVELLTRLLDAGPVRLMTLAPELPGALELIDFLHARGVRVSLGHTNATAEEAHAAFDAGVGTVTHLFNAMRPFRHRDPGIAGAALARDDVIVQLILDGHHVAADTARLVWNAAAGRVALVTDAMAGASVGDGRYRLGDVEVEVRGGSARSGEDVLAGSVLTMIEAVRNLSELGVPFERAVDAATAVPARVVGADAGVLAPGADADVVVLDDNLEIERVLVGGEALVAA